MKFSRILKFKMNGEDIQWVQSKLKEYNFYTGKINGYYNEETLKSVTDFQKAVGIQPNGIITSQCWSQLINYSLEKEIIVAREVIDIPLSVSYTDENGLKIYDYLVDESRYYDTKTKKNTIWLKNTNGTYRPDHRIDSTSHELITDGINTSELKSATHYVIGGSNKKDSLWDGKVVRAFDDRSWAYHLNINESGNSQQLNSKSISIDICNYGRFILNNGKFYTYNGFLFEDEDEIIKLDKPFLGYIYWHKYTDSQIESLRKLIIHLKSKYYLEIDSKIYNDEWFNYNRKWFGLGGLKTQSQVNLNSFGITPQPEMVKMLNNL